MRFLKTVIVVGASSLILGIVGCNKNSETTDAGAGAAPPSTAPSTPPGGQPPPSQNPSQGKRGPQTM